VNILGAWGEVLQKLIKKRKEKWKRRTGNNTPIVDLLEHYLLTASIYLCMVTLDFVQLIYSHTRKLTKIQTATKNLVIKIPLFLRYVVCVEKEVSGISILVEKLND
jgi:hypothetical protein